MKRSELGTDAAPRPLKRSHPSKRAAKGGAWGDELRDRLRALRDAERLSQRAFAARAGVTPSRVTEWLSGAQLPSAESLRQVAEAFGVCLNWLLCGDGGAAPVYRAQSRSRADLERDVAAHVAREVAARVGNAGPVPLRVDMVTADGARLLDACVEQAAGEFGPWLTSVVGDLTRALHQAESDHYVERFKVFTYIEFQGIAPGTDDAAAALLGAFNENTAAVAALGIPQPPREPNLTTLTQEGADEIVRALSEHHCINARVDEFNDAFHRLSKEHHAAWLKALGIDDRALFGGGKGAGRKPSTG